VVWIDLDGNSTNDFEDLLDRCAQILRPYPVVLTVRDDDGFPTVYVNDRHCGRILDNA
jgi:hypothetical protein